MPPMVPQTGIGSSASDVLGMRLWPWRHRFDITLALSVFAMVWLAMLVGVATPVPGDNIEQLTWVRSLEWGYYKHPPVATWLLWLPSRLFGLSAWTSYATGAAVVMASMAMFWHLLLQARGRAYATVALLTVLCITYYNGRLQIYNHNVALMPFVVASAWLCLKAFKDRRLRWWAGLGLVLGLGALAKYQIAVTGLSLIAFWLQQRAWRDPLHRLGLALAVLLASLVFAPHVLWLQEHDFGPIHYAIDSSLGARLSLGERSFDSLHWVLDQLFKRALPGWVMLALVIAKLRRDRRRGRCGADGAEASPGDATRTLIWCWGVLPLLFMPLVGMMFGSDLQSHWGTPFLLFAVPALMEFFPQHLWEQVDTAHMRRTFLVIQCLLLAVTCVSELRRVDASRDEVTSVDSLSVAARAALGGPIRVVIGPAKEAGALSLQLAEHPLVLMAGSYENSPWIQRSLVAQCGAVELIPSSIARDGEPMQGQFAGLSWRIVKPVLGDARGSLNVVHQ